MSKLLRKLNKVFLSIQRNDRKDKVNRDRDNSNGQKHPDEALYAFSIKIVDNIIHEILLY